MNRSRTASRPPIGCAQLFAALAALLLLGAATARAAASYTLELRDAQGAPLEHAVLALFGQQAPTPPAALAQGDPPRAVMDQRGHRFEPHVLAVRVGTAVEFPNRDRTRYRAELRHPGLLEQGPRLLGELELAEDEARSQRAQLEVRPSSPRQPEQSELRSRFQRQGAP